ncbi:neutral/alkaline non-lysosomal ceramidase N-terminal domain-containing protein [Massilibacteroides vaginae]|uniref:neutral/alkaline non-lysosomal ceramidase N-terminal domain-containing protein n=1 Tax=Massilibacteroides vaginae TaxID=1673718 RepID=UPI000A1C961E|nr:neutral/alkaline non-lysosomal ceramidase N-terminal domain-containing protein [Massilibacteroides vaginae]
MIKQLKAGAAVRNITPKKPHFLFGYPFVERMSTGVHDWLYSSALYLSDGDQQTIFISNDVIYVNKDSVARIRKAINKQTGIPEENILIAATHTHSGPVTVDCVISANDPIVPKADKAYVEEMERKTIESACAAFNQAVPAQSAFLKADGTGIGTNRHNPLGPKDLEIPVLILKNQDNEYIATMLVCNMHPTVLHEDSTLYTSDFPFYTRDILQKLFLGVDCPVIYFTGACGNQSPRHVTKENTFAEAKRLGNIVAQAIGEKLVSDLTYSSVVKIGCKQRLVELKRKCFPSVESAEQHRLSAKKKFETLKEHSQNTQEIRSAEVDWFGSEEIAFLSKLSSSETLEAAYAKCLPAEIQIINIDDWNFVAWPGEIFIEYALQLKEQAKNAFLITLANGELQGYISTEEANEKGYYEASNSLFDYTSGAILLEETLKELKSI